MKRFISILAAISVFAAGARADEGMWLLPLIQKMNSKALKEAGCELSPKQIYSINGSSLKNAIVQFGGGCTGEIISNEGLLVTNHHCGYGNIQKLSTVENDYLKDGYWAMNRSEELPCEGLSVTFLEFMEDVTSDLNKAESTARKTYAGTEDEEVKVQEALAAAKGTLIEKALKSKPYCEARIQSFYNDNIWYLIVYKVYKDVRFVGAPPSSIGKFGADTDNWMWPRHTGDFSMFRVYADKKNNPAEYSPENVPYRTKDNLKISVKGINEGDYTMIMGYPGRTTRFQTSPELKMQIELNDIRIAARTIRQEVMLEEMLADPKVKIQYASKYSSSSNGWKKWRGMKLAFAKLGIIGRAEEEEAAFEKWISSDRKGARQEKYGNALSDIRNATEQAREASIAFTKVFESIYRIEITNFATRFSAIFKKELKEGKDTTAALNAAYESIVPMYKDYSATVDRKVARAMLKFYRDNADKEHYLSGLDGDFATMDIDGFVNRLFEESAFVSEKSLFSAIADKGAAVMNDPAFSTAESIMTVAYGTNAAANDKNAAVEKARQNYMAGMLEWKDGEPSYPDANFTMRLTYGKVGGYSPKDGVLYRYYTTLDGVMEKEDPDNWEFVVPDKLKTLWQDKDFGRYAMPDGKMPVAFLSNNDITGGNSGSPVLNAKGELIGLAFDGNWESMSSDVMFEPDLQRCINVDIRYVLFIVDKYAGAGWLLKEMDIVRK